GAVHLQVVNCNLAHQIRVYFLVAVGYFGPYVQPSVIEIGVVTIALHKSHSPKQTEQLTGFDIGNSDHR
ncbi:MAG: hypothetical protein J4G13_15915, partial [Dehalococcoidia bacterium]|nr:hypothetical protein [Dehalococcoidia bacterium]